ncbi:MAG: MerR family transcriptional regulator [Chloroflexi bacterium]|nr:MerR family transcriptional regulator [Chloroflexota bacterium]MCI0574887.1 MerR family transcriptional regulator [Chloroflexota bacterium]MCI0648389.1 MerR family transcriptional regulator [Chloroflexota bacterium]MCI0727510.1 MerR family transcriptional regulator [Chloroflexota bacterium]
MTATLTIGEIARLFGVTPKALRHYEKLGLLTPGRSENSYRQYRPEDVLRLQQMRQLQTLGLSLKQIRDILDHRDDEGLWSRLLQSLRAEVAAEIARLEERRQHLDALLAAGFAGPLEGNSALLPVMEPVDAYLAQYLPEALGAQWRRDQTIYAQFGRLAGRSPALAILWAILAGRSPALAAYRGQVLTGVAYDGGLPALADPFDAVAASFFQEVGR